MRRWLALVLGACVALSMLPCLAEEPPVEAAPVEARPEELELALGAPPGPDGAVRAAEAYLEPAATVDPEATLAPEATLIPAATVDPEATLAPETTLIPEATLAPTLAPIALNVPALELGVKESATLAVSGEALGRLRYVSSDPAVARVNARGKVTGRGKGSAVVTVTAAGGRTAACLVRVKAAPKSVSLNVSQLTLGYDAKKALGARFALAATLAPENTASAVTYSGYDPAVVEVTHAGEVIARGKGKTTIIASTFNRAMAKVKVTVLAAPGRVRLDRTSLSLYPGETWALQAKLPSNTAGDVRFESSRPAVVAVDAETGALVAVKRGSAVITAVSFNGKKARCAVRVGYTPRKLRLAKKKVTLGVGEGLELEPRALTRSGSPAGGMLTCDSSDSAVATVDEAGAVKAVGPGRAKITVSLQSGLKAECAVTVKRAPESVRLSARAPKLSVGGQTALKVRLSPGSASNRLTYSGYDEAVVQVSGNGAVQAVGSGETQVTVTAFNGLEASCHLRVLSPGSRRTVVVAHRGGAGDWPENSLEAFRHAPASGADDVELDVRSAKDGAQVVHHDATFTARGKRHTIEKLTLGQIKALDDDICTLDEALEVIAPTGLGLQLEMKASADPEACVRAVERHGMQGRVGYIAFDFGLLKKVRALCPQARLGLLFSKKPPGLDADIAELKPFGIYQKAMYLTPADLVDWQNRGLRVGAWTLNDAETARDWIEAGLDYVTTDDPAMVVGIVEN